MLYGDNVIDSERISENFSLWDAEVRAFLSGSQRCWKYGQIILSEVVFFVDKVDSNTAAWTAYYNAQLYAAGQPQQQQQSTQQQQQQQQQQSALFNPVNHVALQAQPCMLTSSAPIFRHS